MAHLALLGAFDFGLPINPNIHEIYFGRQLDGRLMWPELVSVWPDGRADFRGAFVDLDG